VHLLADDCRKEQQWRGTVTWRVVQFG